MKVVILAAGIGNRMKPLTNSTPKPLLKVDNEALIERIIKSFDRYEIEEFIVVTGYMSEKIVSFFERNLSDYPVRFVKNEIYRSTNNIHSLNLALNYIEDEDLILIEADLIYESSLIELLMDSTSENIALIDEFKTGMDGTVVKLNEKENIKEFIPSNLQDSNFDYTGCYKTINIYRFSSKTINTQMKPLINTYFNNYNNNCYYELVFGILLYTGSNLIIKGVKAENLIWAEVDDPCDLSHLNFKFKKEKRLEILDNSYGGFWNYDIKDFCFMKNNYFPKPAMYSKIKNDMEKLINNYGSEQDTLNQKMAYFLVADKKSVIALNGASQGILELSRKFANKKAALFSPAFGEYDRLFNIVHRIEDNGSVNINKFIETAENNNIDLLLITNPNNPTGTFISNTQMIEILKKADRSGTKVILDESFMAFSPESSIRGFIEEKGFTNVYILASLCKSLGIPGLRLGYIYSIDTDLLEKINNDLPVWNMNSIAEYLLELLLKNRTSLKESYEKVIGEREKLYKDLLSLSDSGIKVYPGQGNFLLIRVEDFNLVKIIRYNLLENYNIYVKDCTNKFDDKYGYIRIAVGRKKENEFLIKAMKFIYSNLNLQQFQIEC